MLLEIVEQLNGEFPIDVFVRSGVEGLASAVDGDVATLMTGFACAEGSALDWQILANDADDFLTLSKETIADSMALLAQGYDGDPAIKAGESVVPAAVLA